MGMDGVEIVVADLSQKSATGAVKADVVAGSHTEVALSMGTGGGRGNAACGNLTRRYPKSKYSVSNIESAGGNRFRKKAVNPPNAS